jgi:carbohydrate-selective porin OprB
VSFCVEGGINLFALFPGRDEDNAGVGVFYTDFSDDAVRDLCLSEPQVNASESVIEFFYQAQITPWLAIKPEFQFTFDPMFAKDDAILFGTRLELSL